jgi:riboflavin kinase/FMN adenylyltransferase
MIIFTELKDVGKIEKTVVAMGNFDGMHIGHVELVRKTVAIASRNGHKSAVFTFSNHPKNAMGGETVVRNIQYPDDKAETIEALGVDYLFSVTFSEDIHRMDKDAFVKDLLIGTFNMAEACCGFNFRYGYKAEGDADSLREAGALLGFAVHVMEAVRVDGETVSSSLIRALIAEGRMEECARYLGRGYFVKGVVGEGNRIGRTFGFPTLNIEMDDSMVIPAYGVYVTECAVDGATHASVTNVGLRPTVNGDAGTARVETHLLDFDGDLYGKAARVVFLKKLRDERRFENVGQLALHIEKDCDDAREYHASRTEADGSAANFASHLLGKSSFTKNPISMTPMKQPPPCTK